jgi:glycosyltransferase involved in cell wall biosynthesis
MKIAFDAKRLFLNRTGLGNYSRHFIHSISPYLESEGEIFLFSPKYGPYFLESTETRAKFVFPGGIWKILYPLWRVFRAAKRSEKEGVQIFHGLSNELPLGLSKSKIKSVVTIHDVIFLRYPDYYHCINRFIYNFKTKISIQNADAVIAISQETKEDIIKYYGINADKIRVVYQDCDPIFYQEYIEADRKRIKEKYKLPDTFMLCVGSIESRKNQLMLVKVLHYLPEYIQLVLVGKSTDYMDEILEYIRVHQMSGRVHFIHNAAWVDFPLLYQNSSVFTYSSRFEGFGIPLVEAMNSGTPIIAVNTSCYPEVCADAALYVEPDNEKEMAKMVNVLLNDPALQKSLRDKGYKRAKYFRPENTMPAMVSLYKELMGK